MATACAEANVVGVIAGKAFHAPGAVVAFITAAPAMSNLSAALWTRLIHGRDRVRATNAFQAGTLLCVAGMAAAALLEGGLGVMVAFALLARCALTGMIAARTDVWRANYPRRQRARIIGNITLLASLIVGLTALLIGAVMDLAGRPRAYALVFGAAALVGLLGVRLFGKIRWRGRVAQLRVERHRRRTGPGGRSAGDSTPGGGLPAMLGVLRRDRMYRRFMAAQFMLGMPQLAVIPVFIIALRDVFRTDFTTAMGLTQAAVTIVPVAVIPLWAPLLDRMHIARFRFWQSWVFVSANLLMWAAFQWHSEAVLYLSRFVLGVASGGGMLAWELGHHDFARREQASLYMGVHVFLTGVRGSFAPFLGTALYAGAAVTLGGVHLGLPAIGAWTFAVMGVVSAVSGVMFWRLDRDIRAAPGKP